MHEIAITRPQFDETECTRYTLIAHAEHKTAWHFDGNYEYGSDDTTNLPNLRGQAYWYPWVPSSEAGGGGAGEYINGENLLSLSLYLYG